MGLSGFVMGSLPSISQEPLPARTPGRQSRSRPLRRRPGSGLHRPGPDQATTRNQGDSRPTPASLDLPGDEGAYCQEGGRGLPEAEEEGEAKESDELQCPDLVQKIDRREENQDNRQRGREATRRDEAGRGDPERPPGSRRVAEP